VHRRGSGTHAAPAEGIQLVPSACAKAAPTALAARNLGWDPAPDPRQRAHQTAAHRLGDGWHGPAGPVQSSPLPGRL